MHKRQALPGRQFRQLRGEFSNQLQPLKDDLLNVIVVLESALEFVEDDLPAMQVQKVRETLTEIAAEANGNWQKHLRPAILSVKACELLSSAGQMLVNRVFSMLYWQRPGDRDRNSRNDPRPDSRAISHIGHSDLADRHGRSCVKRRTRSRASASNVRSDDRRR